MRLYLFRDFIYETKSTPSEVLDMFDDRAKKIKENGVSENIGLSSLTFILFLVIFG